MNKIEKVMYPLMMVLSGGTAVVHMFTNGDVFWPMITFVWVGIAWTNFKRN